MRRAKPLKEEQIDQYLSSWVELNRAIMTITDEGQLLQILDAEANRKPEPRGMYWMRIHARYNLMRGRREKAEMISKLASPPLSKLRGVKHERP